MWVYAGAGVEAGGVMINRIFEHKTKFEQFSFWLEYISMCFCISQDLWDDDYYRSPGYYVNLDITGVDADYFVSLLVQIMLGHPVEEKFCFVEEDASTSILELIYDRFYTSAVCEMEDYFSSSLGSIDTDHALCLISNALVHLGDSYVDECEEYCGKITDPLTLIDTLRGNSDLWDEDFDIPCLFGASPEHSLMPRHFLNKEDEINRAIALLRGTAIWNQSPNDFPDKIQKKAKQIMRGLSGIGNPKAVKSKRRETAIRQELTNGGKSLYLMKCESTGYYKIGISKNPKVRESTLQPERPTIKLVGEWKGLSGLERTLHAQYSDQRVRGEWFDLTKAQVRYLCRDLTKKVS